MTQAIVAVARPLGMASQGAADARSYPRSIVT
jgi:hypothetical protein